MTPRGIGTMATGTVVRICRGDSPCTIATGTATDSPLARSADGITVAGNRSVGEPVAVEGCGTSNAASSTPGSSVRHHGEATTCSPAVAA